MSTLSITTAVEGMGTPKSFLNQYSETLPILLDNESVADAQTDFLINLAIDVDQVKAFVMASDQDVLIETNSGAAPDDPISLLAGVPYVWTEDSYDAFLLTVDVTKLYVTNASGATAVINIWGVADPSP